MKKINNYKTKAAAVFLICTALLTSCGNSYSSSQLAQSNSKGMSYFSGSTASYDAATEEACYDYSDDSYSYEETDSTVYAASADETKQQNVSGADINREMLVYSCSMSVDVLDFEGASEQFKVKLDQYQGFVESENLSDGSYYSGYYDKNEEKWHTYTATVRVPSRVYDDFCTAVSELGDLRSKNASVENVSQEYSDLSTTLAIYEQKEDRYLEMLANAKDETNAVAIEDKLTEVQVEIAKLKTRMNQIKTDVAYSYVYVTIKEVKEYKEQPVHTDTFGERLLNTLKDAGSSFLDFLEGLLFFLIYAVPYLVLIGIVIFLFVKIIKALAAASKKRKEKRSLTKAEKDQNKAKVKETETVKNERPAESPDEKSGSESDTEEKNKE